MNSKLTKIVLWLAAVFFIYEVVGDIMEGSSFVHYFLEAAFFALVFVTLLLEYFMSKRYELTIAKNHTELQSLKGKLADVVQEQLTQWKLSKSEKEVAWLIIKGFSFNEIARIRSVAEKTVRQQASAIYKKSNTDNRADFTASFLNDILHIEHSVAN